MTWRREPEADASPIAPVGDQARTQVASCGKGGTIMHQRTRPSTLSRRRLLAMSSVLAAATLGGRQRLVPGALAAGRTLTIADIGVGDPGGDWSRFEKPTGHQVNLVSIGNAPSAVVNQLIAGGGQ